MPMLQTQPLPVLDPSMAPPLVLGTGALTQAAMQGHRHAHLLQMIDATAPDPAARRFDIGIASQLAFRRAEGLALQQTALAASPLFRIRGSEPEGTPALRLLALMLPGDLMVNAPIDCITGHLDIQLDLLFLQPGAKLPDAIPDHDVMFVAASEAAPPELRRLARLFDAWPRPALNDPSLLPLFARDRLPRRLSGIPGLCSPRAVAVTRESLVRLFREAGAIAELLPGAEYPVLLRPAGSHAGAGLQRIDTADDLVRYLLLCPEAAHTLTEFVDYRSADGQYRKWRVGFIDRTPHLCHMAVSDDWMIHYLNAGMTGSAEKREEEAAAMNGFDAGFAARHADAFASLHERLPFDYYQIDCAELPDGRLIVFEADTASIVHMMDPPDLFPYKQAHMRRVFDAFRSMVARRAVRRTAPAATLPRLRSPAPAEPVAGW